MNATQFLLERLMLTNGLSVRESKYDNAFWYTSGIPGPFYVNTEYIAGGVEVEKTLEKINTILDYDCSSNQKVNFIFDLITFLIESDIDYSNSIDVLIDFYLANNSCTPKFISGGERRDWFFSIPIAKKLKIPHITLFKSGDYHVTDYEGKTIEVELENKKILHVADIINQASSYVEKWIPILNSINVNFTETLTVAIRNQEGVETLNSNGISVISPLIIDNNLFDEAYSLNLINQFAHKEVVEYYHSPRKWVKWFLMENKIDSINLSSIEKERINIFKRNDPYNLKNEIPEFFF